MYTIATHSGSFHADDVFAVAAFQLLLGKENVKVIRTRDDAVIAEADYVVDVGERYDHTEKRYDHHQPGAPVHENGVPYAGFGLMWRHYGAEICDSEEIAAKLDKSLCQPIDACDNAIQVWETGKFELEPLEWDSIVKTWKALSFDAKEMDERFLEVVGFARRYLELKIAKAQKQIADREAAEAFYMASADKEILVSEKPLSRMWFIEYPEPKVLVCPRDETESSDWMAIAVPVAKTGFETRVRFPETWAGLRDAELAAVSDLPGAKFCHKDRYMCITRSRETSIRAAESAN